MVDIRINYETLFDLLRREKNREELQSLDKDFYEQVLAYLREKKDSLSKKEDELFVSAEREKLKIQFQNIRRIIKELYEKREKKIINMATSRARTGSEES
jgi:DNA replication initiation complex subunit (GINS family)